MTLLQNMYVKVINGAALDNIWGIARRYLQAIIDCPLWLQVVKRLHTDAGWRAFYKGLIPEYLKVLIHVYTCSACTV